MPFMLASFLLSMVVHSLSPPVYYDEVAINHANILSSARSRSRTLPNVVETMIIPHNGTVAFCL